MVEMGLALSQDVQQFSADSVGDDAQNDAPDAISATMADDFADVAPALDALLARLLTAWEHLSDVDRQRLVDDAERLAKGR